MQPLPEVQLSWRYLSCLVVLSGLAFGLGLGSSTRLTYHEAFVAQGGTGDSELRSLVAPDNWGLAMVGETPAAVLAGSRLGVVHGHD